MKFYGITMQGKFVNQTLADVPPTFVPSTDTGRLIYNEDDGFLWWGDAESGRWRSLGEGGGDASEIEDMFSDLLRTTVFLNASYDEFSTNMTTNLLVDHNNSSPELVNLYNSDLKAHVFNAPNQYITSNNLFDPHTGLSNILYCMVSAFWQDSHPHINTPLLEVSNNGGTTWEITRNNEMHRFVSTGIDLRMRLTSTGTGEGTLFGWGVFYNKDISVDCTKQALTKTTIVYPDPLNVQYTIGAILIYLNGVLLDDSDYTATDGETITIDNPPLQNGDIVTIITFGTSVLDSADFIRKDALTPWNNGVSQSVNNGKFTDLAPGVNDTDSVNYGQFISQPSIVRVEPINIIELNEGNFRPEDSEYQLYNVESVVIDANDHLPTPMPVWANGLMFRIHLEVDNHDSDMPVLAFNDQQHLKFYLMANELTATWEMISYANQGAHKTSNIESLNTNDVFAVPAFTDPYKFRYKIEYSLTGSLIQFNRPYVKFDLIGYYK